MIKLSLCMATYMRGDYLQETLDSIVPQLELGTELIVVDGASPDSTPDVMQKYSQNCKVRYYPEKENLGVDRDYDKAVGYANGEYCWLVTDDDILKPDAIRELLDSLKSGCNLLVLNSEIKDAQLSNVLKDQAIQGGDLVIPNDPELFFKQFAFHLTFIGYVVIKRDLWLARDRESYFNTAFIHVGVIFQFPPIEHVQFKSKPLLTIRYGNAMWTARGFLIWTFNWPRLIWSFKAFSDLAKEAVSSQKPYENIRMLMYQRALGAFTIKEYTQFLFFKSSVLSNLTGLIIAVTPGSVINAITYLYFKKYKANEALALYDLRRSIFHSNWLVKLFS